MKNKRAGLLLAVMAGGAMAVLTVAPMVLADEFAPPPCTQTVTGDVAGPLTVDAGETLCITNARVVGPVQVDSGEALVVTNSRVTGGIVTDEAAYVSVCGSQIAGDPDLPETGLMILDSAGPVRIGDPASGCAGNSVAGPVSLVQNLAGITFGANRVSRFVAVEQNVGTTVIKANTVFGVLGCNGNVPAPVNDGQPNTAASKKGQCAGL